jgi:hypothetical protein
MLYSDPPDVYIYVCVQATGVLSSSTAAAHDLTLVLDILHADILVIPHIINNNQSL